MFKKVMIVSLLLLAIFSIGAVSAAENLSDTNIGTVEINEELNVENDIESVEEVEDDFLSSAPEDEKLEVQDESTLGASSIENYIRVSDTVEIDDYGNSNTVVYISSINYYASGTISIDIDNENVYNSQVSRYKYIFAEQFSKLPSYGLHNLTVSYSGDTYYNPFTKTYSVEFTYPFSVNYYYYLNESVFRVELPRNSNDEVNLQLNGEDLGNISLDTNKNFYVDLNKFNLGYNNITLTYEDPIHPKKTIFKEFYVDAQFTIPSRYIIDDEEAIITVNVPKHEEGILVLTRTLHESHVQEVHVEESVLKEFDSQNTFINSVKVVNGTASIVVPKTNSYESFYAEFIGNIRSYIYFDINFISTSPSIKINHPSEVTEGDIIKIQMENQGNEELKSHFEIQKQAKYSITYITVLRPVD